MASESDLEDVFNTNEWQEPLEDFTPPETSPQCSPRISPLGNCHGDGCVPSPEAVVGNPFDQQDLLATSDAMGIENTWTDAEEYTVQSRFNYAIPLPPPGYDGVACTSTDLPIGDAAPFNSPIHENMYGAEAESGEVKDVTSTPAVCGLYNLGNTCFMAAGLQCLVNTPSLAQYFLHHKFASESECSRTLTNQFAILLYKMWYGQLRSFKPSDFKQMFAAKHEQFKEYRQHDCQEFLTLLLDSLHDNLKPKNNEAETSAAVCDSDSVFMDLVAEENSKEELADCTSEAFPSVTVLSESSRSSQASSPRSSDSINSADRNVGYRFRPIPDSVKTQADSQLNLSIGDGSDSNNLVDPATLRSSSRGSEHRPEKNEVASQLNTLSLAHPSIAALGDILKVEPKMSNVNVLSNDPLPNNALRFDSEKFPKAEAVRPREAVENLNLTTTYVFPDKAASGLKRIKETNLMLQESSEGSSIHSGTNVKRMKFDSVETLVGKEDSNGAGEISSLPCEISEIVLNPAQLKEKAEADSHWARHLADNRSVVVETFQGQFQNTVVCKECQHISVTYEPFMFLPVPVPGPEEWQLCVTFVPASPSKPIKYLLVVKKTDDIIDLKKKLRESANLPDSCEIVLAEVSNHHIIRILNPSVSAHQIDDKNCLVYGFQLPQPPGANEVISHSYSLPSCTVNIAYDTPPPPEEPSAPFANGKHKGDGDGEDWKMCVICLSEMPAKDLLYHLGCDCRLCETCKESWKKHCEYEDGLRCPVCNEVTQSTEFVPLNQPIELEPAKTRTLLVPLVYRLDTEGDGNNNKKNCRLFGHPGLLKLPSPLPAAEFYRFLKAHVRQLGPCDVLFVNREQGVRCSRCTYSAHCSGCEVPADGEIRIQNSDALAFRFMSSTHFNPKDAETVTEDVSLSQKRDNPPLSIYDCFAAFCKSEDLDDPWYCPSCKKNQHATKTLKVCRYPDFLIVHLKRFSFQDSFSNKIVDHVEFPTEGLDVSAYISGPRRNELLEFNLYALVCHFGNANAGHYTAYAKNPVTSEWHLFNDHNVTQQLPEESDRSNAYLLFYQREGIKYEVKLDPPCDNENGSTCSSPNLENLRTKQAIDHLIEKLDKAKQNEAE